jgi:outer membrane protein OmpA-like peptidoglycan-associated protein/tetratricopeptide (TPR) repeat protein
MSTKRLFLATLMMAFMVTCAIAQKSSLKRANDLMKGLNYATAIPIYNSILQKHDNAEAKINIAECYLKVKDFENAEFWYSQVVKLPEAQPVHKLYYGEMLQANGKCDQAREWFEQFSNDMPDDARGKYKLASCDQEEEFMTKSAGIYEIKHMNFNSPKDDISPNYYKDGVVFASERDKGSAVKREHSWTGDPFLELYYVNAKEQAECGNATYGKPNKLSNVLNSKYHEAAISMNESQDRIFFTRNNFLAGKSGKSDEKIIKLNIYTAKANGTGFSNVESISINSKEYSTCHPALSNDGKRLYFASDMPGGFGGMDLYYSEGEGTNWGPPTNLGPEFNTEGNEVFPYFDQEGKLYYSSDGLSGLGGLDIYVLEPLENNNFSAPENIGFPINSTYDDFGIALNKETTCGYFTSSRKGGSGGDDIYSFKKVASPIQILVYDKETGKPIQGATVMNDCTGNSLVTKENGKVTFDMRPETKCLFKASADSYTPNQKEGSTEGVKVGKKVFVEIPLEKEIKFDLEGVVFDGNTGLPLDGATVTLTNNCGRPEQSFTSTEGGRYNFKLDSDCCYQVKGEKVNYLSSKKDSICTKGLSKGTVLKQNLTLQPYLVSPEEPKGPSVVKDPQTGLYVDNTTKVPANKDLGGGVTIKDGKMYKDGKPYSPNGEFEKGPIQKDGQPIPFLLHIYYDFDQAYIRDDANPELNKLLGMMKDNPNLIVEIGSHTDARGSGTYNTRLASRRAESVKRWLTNKGISVKRLQTKGYGENLNVNNCKDNIPCSEKEHQLNRRTEFRVVGRLDGKEVQVSQPNSNPRVSECRHCPF